jgi:hypothetical protein
MGMMWAQEKRREHEKKWWSWTCSVSLCHAFMQSVGANVVHVEWREGVGSKIYPWIFVVKKAEPCCEQRTVEVLNSAPQVLPHDIVKGFL